MSYKLIKEILSRSESKDWDSAKLEWDFVSVFESEVEETCLCGHYPIKNICIIENLKNGNSVEIGNCCVKKFIDVDIGDKVILSRRRIKDDITKGLNEITLDYLYDNDIINDWEYNFSLNTKLKRRLSGKQSEVRKKINNKFLKFTSRI
jgi:hypothetical protein